jgi:RHS repeat-associated protein
MLKSRRKKLLSIVSLIPIMLMLSTSILAQGGSGTPRESNSDGKADSNLKSLARINPSTLAMELTLPLMSYPGRSGNSLPFALHYSSKLWRMKNKATYYYTTPIGNYRQYVTQLLPTYAERSAAGWTSSIAFPVIEEKLEKFDQDGDPFSLGLDIAEFDYFCEGASTENGSSLINNPDLPCGMTCVERSRWCMDSVCTPWECTAWDYNTANCGGGGANGSCTYINGYCPPECPYCTEQPNCPPAFPDCGNPPNYPPPPEPPPTTHYIKRLHVRMSDGSSKEFRKSDGAYGYCSDSEHDGPNCEGTGADNHGVFLAVDGSGSRLIRDANGSTLLLPDGSQYSFANISTATFDRTTLYQATVFIDAAGNISTFEATNNENQFTLSDQRIRRFTDTVGREINDPLPLNLVHQQQVEGLQSIDLPSMEGQQPQTYQLKWLHLKPVPCDPPSTTTNCGSTEGALENQSESLYFYSSQTCIGSSETPVDPNNQYPNEKLFPANGIGLRSCNPDSGGTPSTATPLRFNPVVLAEIILPNQKKYEFKYNQYGEITKIKYPTGAFETFSYSLIPPMNGFNETAYDQTNRGVIEMRRHNSDGVLEQRMQYSAQFDYNNYVNSAYKITTTASKADSPLSDGVISERYLHVDTRGKHPFGFSDARVGMPKEEIVRDEIGNIRSRALSEWISSGPLPTNDPLRPARVEAQRDPRVKRKVSITIENGQALATLSETEYDENGSTDPEHFSHLNAKRSKSHQFRNIPLSLAQTGTIEQIASYFNSSTVAAISESDYAYDASYKARGIPSLPIETRSLDPADNSVLAKTQTIYDNQFPAAAANYPSAYSIQNYGIAVSFDCSEDPQEPKICWEDPNTQYLGRPTTSRLWDSDNNIWIETHTRYDIFGNAIAARDPIGNESTTLYEDTPGKLYKYAYPTRVDTTAPDPTGVHGTSEGSFSTSTYDFMTGLPLTSTDEFGQTTATEYNDPLLRPTRAYALNFTAPESQTIYDDDNLTVTVRKQIDANNWDEATTYMDSLGRAVKTRAADSQGDVFVETKYDFLGRPHMTTNPYRQGDTVLWSLTEYDELGRPFQSREPVENQNPLNPSGDILGVTSYDISTAPGYLGIAVMTTDAAGKKSRSITNALGQLVVVEEPDHQGNLDPLPQSSPEPSPTPGGGGSPAPQPPCLTGQCPVELGPGEYPSYATYYRYDALGKMVEVTQGVQKRWFKYDSLGRLIRVRQPEQEVNTALSLADPYNTSGEWTAGFTYDVMGNVLTATDANGVTITNTYDNAGRVKTRTYYGEPQGVTTPAVSFYYDGKGLATQQSPNFAKGKLTKITSSVSETRYTQFDNFGRLLSTEQRTPLDGQTVSQATPYVSSYVYNLSGALVQETYPSGRVVKNEFEPDGDLARIYGTASPNDTERTYANSFSYMPDGRIEKLRLGNGLWENAKFNTRLQVTEFALGHGVTSGDLWRLQQEYGEIDANGDLDTTKNTGNIARQTLSFDGLAQPFVTSYKYDSLYRLAHAKETQNGTRTWEQAFTYDRYCNRTGHEKFIGQTELTQTNITHPTIDENTNRFEANQGYAFDKNGNLVTDPTDSGRSFVFNGDNKQKEVRDASNVLIGEYFYDGEGKRVKKHTYQGGVLDEITIFVYSAGKLIAEYSTAPPPQDPTTKWTVTDQLGSPRILVNSLGEVVARRDFMPFGEEIFPDGAHRTTNLNYNFGDNIRQKFTGYQKDEETQLDFAEARMYQNLHGRFTAVDPLLASGKSANPQTFNRYVYVINNPLIYTDPTGLQVASQTGTVFQRGEFEFAMFGDGVPVDPGYEPFSGDVTYPASDGYRYNVTANGWTNLGLSLTGQIQQAAANRLTQDQTRALLNGFAQSSNNATTGISTGTNNFARGIFNTFTNPLGPVGAAVGFPNPLALDRVPYPNPQAAAYGFSTEAFWIAGSTAATGGATASGLSRSSTLSVVPETTSFSTTQRLQFHVSRAAREVDAAGDAAFTPKQFEALTNNPNLRPMFRGNRIDVRARRYVSEDSALSHLESNYNRGADFVNPMSGRWWDMTTPGQWQRHIVRYRDSYGGNGTLLRTQ